MVESRRKTRPDFLTMRMLHRERDEELGDLFLDPEVLDMAHDEKTPLEVAFPFDRWETAPFWQGK